MRLIDQIRASLAQFLVKYGGTLALPTGKENYPIALSNEVKGGHHTFNDFEDLAQQGHDKLQLNMLASVAQHEDGNGNIIKGATYKLEKMPPMRISDIPDYDISEYWKVFKPEQDFVGTIETQYAPDYNNKRPLFQPPSISEERYQDGYASNIDDTIIWEDEYDASKKHKWQRQRYGSNSTWGIPVQVWSEGYEKGNYIDNIFRWVLKDAPAPARPLSSVNGKPNNNPEGWMDVPEPPEGVSYEDYVNGTGGQVAHDLYRTSGLKNAYQQLLSEWEIPIKISTNPLLVRYGNQPTSTDYLNNENTNTWRGYYTPGTDTHMASRPDELSEWEIAQIDNESGEYTEFVYKAFPATYTPTENDSPTDPQPFKARYLDGRNAPNDWSDAPYQAEHGQILYYSIAKKFNDGSLKRSWSKPKRADGLDTIQAVIEPQGKYIFKKKIVDGESVVDPSQIVLKAVLYEGNDIVSSGISVKWFKNNTQITILPHHTISGDTLTILPDGVSELETYKAEITYQEKTFSDTINILDVTDGQAFETAIISKTGFTFKGEEEKEFSAQFYKNGEANNSGVTFNWVLLDSDGDSFDFSGETINIPANIVDDYASLTLTATFGGITRTRTETLTDVEDGKGYSIQYSRSTATDPLSIPSNSWREGADAGWTDWPTGAIWQRIRKDGDSEWSNPIRVAGEKGKPNGGLSRNVFKLSITKPSFSGSQNLSVKEGLLPDVAGWTDDPGDPVGEQSVWMSSAFFTMHPDAVINPDGSVDLIPSNWILSGKWSNPIKTSGKDGVAIGVPGKDGNPGENGWSPIIENIIVTNTNTIKTGAIEPTDKIIQRVSNWTGGTGTKPPTGMYISPSGFTTIISQATNIRGAAGAGYSNSLVSGGTPIHGSWTLVSGATNNVLTVGISNPENITRTFKIEASLVIRSNSQNTHEDWIVRLYKNNTSTPNNIISESRCYIPYPEYREVNLSATLSIPHGYNQNSVILRMERQFGTSASRSTGYLIAYAI